MAEAWGIDLTFEDGAQAVALARSAVRAYVLRGQRKHPGSMRDAFYHRTGVLVRLESTTGRGGLRGCAGSYNGRDQVGHAVVDAAIEAASADSCGSEVSTAELSNLTVSVCIVCDITATANPLEELELGRHGLAITHAGETAWTYQTVPVDHGWTSTEYLDRTCRKAGLSPDAWKAEGVTIELFEGAVFREREPAGSIEAI